MFKIIVFIAFLVVACQGAPGSGTYCGKTPNNIFACSHSPTVISHDVTLKCDDLTLSECEKMTCLFRESKWLNGNAVNKAKVISHFDQLAKDHPEWSPAVQHLKAACLGPVDLQAQGTFLNCPAYDIMHCVFSSFIKHAAPSQWLTTGECTYPRAYAAACPVCPEDCFAPQVPFGSCNACLSLPRSP